MSKEKVAWLVVFGLIMAGILVFGVFIGVRNNIQNRAACSNAGGVLMSDAQGNHVCLAIPVIPLEP